MSMREQRLGLLYGMGTKHNWSTGFSMTFLTPEQSLLINMRVANTNIYRMLRWSNEETDAFCAAFLEKNLRGRG